MRGWDFRSCSASPIPMPRSSALRTVRPAAQTFRSALLALVNTVRGCRRGRQIWQRPRYHGISAAKMLRTAPVLSAPLRKVAALHSAEDFEGFLFLRGPGRAERVNGALQDVPGLRQGDHVLVQ